MFYYDNNYCETDYQYIRFVNSTGVYFFTSEFLQGCKLDCTIMKSERYCFQIRYFRSKQVFVLLIWNTVLSGSFVLGNNCLRLIFPKAYDVETEISWKVDFAKRSLVAAMYFLYPVAGLIGDAWLGRYRAIVYSFWVTFAAVVMGTISTTVHTYGHVPNYITAAMMASSFFVLVVGQALFLVNVMPFGIDQLEGASSDELSSYVHWYVWSFLVGQAISKFTDFMMLYWGYKYIFPVAWLCFAYLYVAMCSVSYYCISSMLIVKEPLNMEVYKQLFEIVNFARKHKHPVRNYILSSCEDKPPARLDNAKQKYGGPFTNEQVEDTKAFARLLLILFAIVLPFVGNLSVWGRINMFIYHLDYFADFQTRDNVWFQVVPFSLPALLLTPIYEFLVHPFLGKHTPGMLKRVWFGLMLMTLAVFSAFVIDFVGHLLKPDTACMTSTYYDTEQHNVSSNSSLGMSSYIAFVPLAINNIGYVITMISSFEFILAQAPYSMKGILIGLFYSIGWGLGTFIEAVIAVLVILGYDNDFPDNKHTKHLHLSCGSVYYITHTLLSLVGLVLCAMACRWYKYRERNEVGPVFFNQQQRDLASSPPHAQQKRTRRLFHT